MVLVSLCVAMEREVQNPPRAIGNEQYMPG